MACAPPRTGTRGLRPNLLEHWQRRMHCLPDEFRTPRLRCGCARCEGLPADSGAACAHTGQFRFATICWGISCAGRVQFSTTGRSGAGGWPPARALKPRLAWFRRAPRLSVGGRVLGQSLGQSRGESAPRIPPGL